jgi:hypothetical protein
MKSHQSMLIGPSGPIKALAGQQQRKAVSKNTSILPLALLDRPFGRQEYSKST